MFEKILGEVLKDSGEFLRRCWGMFETISGNVREDSEQCWKRFGGMLFRKCSQI